PGQGDAYPGELLRDDEGVRHEEDADGDRGCQAVALRTSSRCGRALGPTLLVHCRSLRVHGDDDLAPAMAGLEQLVRRTGVVQGQHAGDDRPEPSVVDGP